MVIGRLFSKGRKPVGGVFHNPPPFPPVLIGLRTPCTVERGTIGLTSAVRSNKISVSYSCYIQYVYLQYIYIHGVCIPAVYIYIHTWCMYTCSTYISQFHLNLTFVPCCIWGIFMWSLFIIEFCPFLMTSRNPTKIKFSVHRDITPNTYAIQFYPR